MAKKVKTQSDKIYNEAVTEARELLTKIDNYQMRLGELADGVQTEYGEGRLKKFAKDLGVSPCTVERYRNVYRNWKDAPGPVPYSVARELQTHPDRYDIVREKPNLTKREARALMDTLNGKDHQEKPRENWASKNTRAWFRDLLQLAGKVIQETELSKPYLNPAMRQVVRDVVEPAALPTLRAAGEAWITLADSLERCLTWEEDWDEEETPPVMPGGDEMMIVPEEEPLEQVPA